MKILVDKMNDLLVYMGFERSTANIWNQIIIFAFVIAIAFVIEAICRKLLLKIIGKVVRSTKAAWDDIIFAPKVIGNLSRVIAPVLIYIFIPIIFPEKSELLEFIMRLFNVYIIAVILRFVNSLLVAVYNTLNTRPQYKDKPLKGLLQTVQIILFIIGAIVIISTLLGKSPAILLTGLGASAAILMLVFQDSIMGFVSGIQLSANNMLRVGDWIEVPKYGADGDVIEVSLNTVKIQNWDKTIVTIPPYLLMKESFQNWRGMEESGVRRIKRSISIDMNSVKFCTPEMLEKFKRIQYVSGYVDQTEETIKKYNEEHQIDNSVLVNGRRQTNLGVFRAYLTNYLKNHPAVHKDMTRMVRQLQPTERGIPIE